MSRTQLILVGETRSLGSLRRQYIVTLIEILGAMGQRCRVDPDLAERIARLIAQEEERA
jgi:hypothetical protein